MEPQRFASGGWAPEEQFVHLGQGRLAESLKTSRAHFETPCGSFADLKLARYLIRFTGRPEYGDGLERTLYNTMLATRLPNSDGDYPYYSDYAAGAEKKYYHRKWPCCSGTLVQGVADYVLNAYFHDDDSLLVNLFVASEVIWKRASGVVVIVQDTGYPSSDAVRLSVREPGDGRFALKLRIPAWAKAATVRVNGKTATVAPGALATVGSRWKAGDTIDLVVPQPLRTLPIDTENPKLAAVMRGTVMYVGLNPWDGLAEQPIDLPGSLSPLSAGGEAYRTVVAGRDLVFVPYFTIDTEKYNTYFTIP
jgi:DUF1680 family protein